ncbi:uncharacterized protein SPPG_08026 [Spizellomyces punctatus DAOM BR117]|uniref:Uncharacterized protein n=1 Tax=Spizellomyces punctatus (strain DAOM BR117) TaxID=645134 RepID=A0A0L0H5D3_SPIPD|nr:uncharacterized protein SPPG_08026 [Spizellomyces punctatus DAOM BR117]KNC96432.1 hypothetical protein SPPG_08026 [Spizellomyces punctatus DAOM BR117]|eukprot:XP_016604472.1 hypothetical protein SPPG_08026 [Spizellomyces punctatus DAOM BR117]
MTLLSLVTSLLAIWSFIYFLLSFCGRSQRRSRRRTSFLPTYSTPPSRVHNSEFHYQFGFFRYTTTVLNQAVFRIGREWNGLWKWWFGREMMAGQMVGSDEVQDFRSKVDWIYSTGGLANHMGNTQGLVALMPGVNLPLSDMGYYVSGILVCALVHEVFVPDAFLTLREASLGLLRPAEKLKIVCAGVWHNVVLVGMVFCMLWGLSWVFLRYRRSEGVVVLDVLDESPLAGHLVVGETVRWVNAN